MSPVDGTTHDPGDAPGVSVPILPLDDASLGNVVRDLPSQLTHLAIQPGLVLGLQLTALERAGRLVDSMGRHLTSDQALVPLRPSGFVVLVARPDWPADQLDPTGHVVAVWVDVGRGVVIPSGTWHSVPLAREEGGQFVNAQAMNVDDDSEQRVLCPPVRLGWIG